MHVVVLAERQVEVRSRDRRDHASVAAVATGDLGAGTRAARAGVTAGGLLEISREADRAQVSLELATIEQAHGGRVGGDHRSVVPCTGGTGKSAAQALGTVFLQLEGSSIGVAESEGAGDADSKCGYAGNSRSGHSGSSL